MRRRCFGHLHTHFEVDMKKQFLAQYMTAQKL